MIFAGFATVYLFEESAFLLIYPLLYIATIIASFIGIFIFGSFDENIDDVDDSAEELAWWLKIIDYRHQPISISLIVFVLSIFSYHIFDAAHIKLENLSYMTHREGPMIQFISALILPIFLMAFLYISHNFNFLGFRPIRHKKEFFTLIHVIDLAVSSMALICWILLLVAYCVT